MVDFLLRTNLAVLLSDTLLTAPLFCGRPHISDCVTRAERARRRIRRIFDHVSPRRPESFRRWRLLMDEAISSFPFCEYPYYTRERRKKLLLFSGWEKAGNGRAQRPPSIKRGLSALCADLPRIILRSMPGARSLRAWLGEHLFFSPLIASGDLPPLYEEGGVPLRRGRAEQSPAPANSILDRRREKTVISRRSPRSRRARPSAAHVRQRSCARASTRNTSRIPH